MMPGLIIGIGVFLILAIGLAYMALEDTPTIVPRIRRHRDDSSWRTGDFKRWEREMRS